eukprot:CAMPEP_0183442708 /NCGR_PEP_ID=MMETSP0370-20130417/89135_1 /TAXON_ID=268820 /ORGANISM="Peridinium aciculiferum, Strain PAER-2" /LENGTH=54 /DNA_ID=CAMNT_0025632423 /DNA_START=12 /DNA_END=173 /DNA_ORIENTATION=-
MVLVEVDAMVVLATGVAATAWVLAVLPNGSPAVRDMAAEVTTLLEASRHRCKGP